MTDVNIPKPPPKVAPPNYAAIVAMFGEAIWGPSWPTNVARFTGLHPRALQRLADNVREGRDHAAAPEILATMHDRLAPLVAQLHPWAQHAKD